MNREGSLEHAWRARVSHNNSDAMDDLISNKPRLASWRTLTTKQDPDGDLSSGYRWPAYPALGLLPCSP